MLEFRCPACTALAYSSASDPRFGKCPSCGAADLEKVGVVRPSQHEPQPLGLSPPYGDPFAMNSSVRAVLPPEGLRG